MAEVERPSDVGGREKEGKSSRLAVETSVILIDTISTIVEFLPKMTS